jgi:hypothetical protein
MARASPSGAASRRPPGPPGGRSVLPSVAVASEQAPSTARWHTPGRALLEDDSLTARWAPDGPRPPLAVVGRSVLSVTPLRAADTADAGIRPFRINVPENALDAE